MTGATQYGRFHDLGSFLVVHIIKTVQFWDLYAGPLF